MRDFRSSLNLITGLLFILLLLFLRTPNGLVSVTFISKPERGFILTGDVFIFNWLFFMRKGWAATTCGFNKILGWSYEIGDREIG